MLKITDRLVAHLCGELKLDQKHLSAATRDENEIRAFVSKSLFDGSLSTEKLAELAKEDKSAAEQKLEKMVSETVTKQFAPMMDMLQKLTGAVGGDGASTSPPGAGAGQQLEQKALNLAGAGAGAGAAGASGQADGTPNPAKAYAAGAAGAGGASNDGSGAGSADLRIQFKSILERFDDTRTALTYDRSESPILRKAFAGRSVTTGEGLDLPSRSLDAPTERKKAIAGVWFKQLIAHAFRDSGRPVPPAYRLSDLDRKLMEAVVHECNFVGPIGMASDDGDAEFWLKGGRIPEMFRKRMLTKALLDDSASGGLEAVPIEFDDLAIMTAVLSGELFPLVTVRNVTRRRIEGFSIGEPTMSWTAEGTAISLFNTSSFIAAFDTNVYAVTGAMEVGLDFEADSPVAIGDLLLERYGQAFRKELDNVIADGNGTDRPLGLMNTSGLSTINSANGSTGPHKLADYEGLLFGVAKQYRTEAGAARSIFLSNELSYRRSRSMSVDVSSDERRLFGLNQESFMTLDHPHKINESLANNEQGFFCVNRYRFYRRAGYGVRVVTEDQTLALKNERMIMVRARCGGQLELADAGVKCTDFQS